MLRRHDIDGEQFVFVVPPTTRDVLDWSVWIHGIEDGEEQVWCALQWVSSWVVGHNEESLGALVGNDLAKVVELGNAIARSAGVPQQKLDDMLGLLDAQNGIDPEWKPKPTCKCLSCRRGIESNQPCQYDGKQGVTTALSRIAEAEDCSAPYYVNQVRAVQHHAEARRLRYEREQNEAKDYSTNRLAEASKRIH